MPGKYIVRGGRRIEGALKMHGAKNAVLPILAASMICGDLTLENCPALSDVEVALKILGHAGCRTERRGREISVMHTGGGSHDIPDTLMAAMRSSIVFLGALLARFGQAEVALPGGCELGPRPIDLHLSALSQMGAQIREEDGRLCCRAPERLHGADILLPFPSVGATENILIAAATAKGETVLHGAAREPEIGDLIAFLQACGAEIRNGPDAVLTIRGVERLHGCRHRVIPDRIAAGTYLCAAAATGGEIELTGIEPAHILSVLAYLTCAGCRVSCGRDGVWLKAPDRLKSMGIIRTQPYPGFPTDMQAILMTVSCLAAGTTVFIENIFENRFRHIPELRKLGARIETAERTAVVSGVEELSGAELSCTDLRGGAAVVLGALAARGESQICGIHHIERGYEDFCGQLSALGADVVLTDG